MYGTVPPPRLDPHPPCEKWLLLGIRIKEQTMRMWSSMGELNFDKIKQAEQGRQEESGYFAGSGSEVATASDVLEALLSAPGKRPLFSGQGPPSVPTRIISYHL